MFFQHIIQVFSKILFYLSTNIWTPNANNDVGCCPSHWWTTDCILVSDANFSPLSIFLHQTCTVKHLLPYIAEWIWFALSLFAHKKTAMACCSLQDNFSANVVAFNVYKWRHSDFIFIKLATGSLVLRIKFLTNIYFGFFIFLEFTEWCRFVNLFIEWSLYYLVYWTLYWLCNCCNYGWFWH